MEEKNLIIGGEIRFINSLDSTNDYIRELHTKQKLSDGFTVIASQQTKGKGFHNNKWESESGKNLTFSFIVFPEFILAGKQFILSQAISLAILDYLKNYSDDFVVKWPNDIYYKNKKIAGILIENSIQGNYLYDSIVGIGLNINQEKFSSSLINPISLKTITGQSYNLDNQLKILMKHIQIRYSQLINNDFDRIQEMYLNNLYQLNKWALYKIKSNLFKGKIIGINKYGFLKIISEKGEEYLFNFKEVEYVL